MSKIKEKVKCFTFRSHSNTLSTSISNSTVLSKPSLQTPHLNRFLSTVSLVHVLSKFFLIPRIFSMLMIMGWLLFWLHRLRPLTINLSYENIWCVSGEVRRVYIHKSAICNWLTLYSDYNLTSLSLSWVRMLNVSISLNTSPRTKTD